MIATREVGLDEIGVVAVGARPGEEASWRQWLVFEELREFRSVNSKRARELEQGGLRWLWGCSGSVPWVCNSHLRVVFSL